ncbi:MAG: hypothetical protein FWD69_00430 [Polyangiaceae bacterium]|nr:hypothetical protein [Polyangiaceae bacterium]
MPSEAPTTHCLEPHDLPTSAIDRERLAAALRACAAPLDSQPRIFVPPPEVLPPRPWTHVAPVAAHAQTSRRRSLAALAIALVVLLLTAIVLHWRAYLVFDTQILSPLLSKVCSTATP